MSADAHVGESRNAAKRRQRHDAGRRSRRSRATSLDLVELVLVGDDASAHNLAEGFLRDEGVHAGLWLAGMGAAAVRLIAETTGVSDAEAMTRLRARVTGPAAAPNDGPA
jgi:hypothetical protein